LTSAQAIGLTPLLVLTAIIVFAVLLLPLLVVIVINIFGINPSFLALAVAVAEICNLLTTLFWS
jgi:hypothetical protein